MCDSSPVPCRSAVRRTVSRSRLVSGLLKISSAFTLVSVPRRDDPDSFFSIFLSPINVDHDVYCGTANPPDRVPALFARFLVGPDFFQDPAFIGKDAGGERKGDAVFFLIQAVLSFVPFQPHVYIVYIYSDAQAMPTQSARSRGEST